MSNHWNKRKPGKATKSEDKGLQVTTGYNTGVVRTKAWLEWIQKRMLRSEMERGRIGNLDKEFGIKSRVALKWSDTSGSWE